MSTVFPRDPSAIIVAAGPVLSTAFGCLFLGRLGERRSTSSVFGGRHSARIRGYVPIGYIGTIRPDRLGYFSFISPGKLATTTPLMRVPTALVGSIS